MVATDLVFFEVPEPKQQEALHDLLIMQRRKGMVAAVTLNVNIISTEKFLRLFGLRPKELDQIGEVIDFHGPTERRRYRCGNNTATCIVLWELSNKEFRGGSSRIMFGRVRRGAVCEITLELLGTDANY